MKNKNPYWFAVLLNLVTCIAVIWWSIWDMSFGLSILYIAEKHTMAVLDIGISSLGLMWGGWKGIKVVLFIIDLYTGPEKDRMRIREMKKIGLWHEETTRDVTKYSECNWVYGKIILKLIRNAKAMKFQIVASGKELAKFADQKIVTFYYFRRSRIIERIAFDEKPEEKK